MILTVLATFLATYYLAFILTQSPGPYGLLERLREDTQVKRFGLLDCFYCTVFWIALGLALPLTLALSLNWHFIPLTALAISGACSIIYSYLTAKMLE